VSPPSSQFELLIVTLHTEPCSDYSYRTQHSRVADTLDPSLPHWVGSSPSRRERQNGSAYDAISRLIKSVAFISHTHWAYKSHRITRDLQGHHEMMYVGQEGG